MLLAEGQGSRLGVLTERSAKPAAAFGGKYRIIDFPLSNCINSGIDTVGVLTQYQPLRLNAHIGIGIPWDLDRMGGGVTILPPKSTAQGSDFYTGTANAVWQNVDYMDAYDPEYVLILTGDHIYRMDYETMLGFHKASGADLTIACIPVPMEDAPRYGIAVSDQVGRVLEFQEKDPHPKSNLASMGIYIFTYRKLREVLAQMKDRPALAFGRHVIPEMQRNGSRIYAYEFNGYWQDAETLQSYWEANMGLVDVVPAFNLYEEHWKIYTKDELFQPQYLGPDASVERSIVGRGCDIRGLVSGSVLSPGVTIGEGAEVRDSILMKGVRVEKGAKLDRCIAAEDAVIGENAVVGCGEYAPSTCDPEIYCSDLVSIAEAGVIPAGVHIGRNTAISGVTAKEDYPGGELASGQALLKGVMP